jgi:Ankyrin repeats (3 copies)
MPEKTCSVATSCPCKKIPWSLSSFTAAEFGELHTLLKKPEVWNRNDSAGYSPLHFAAQHNHVAVTSLLLKSGVNVNGEDDKNDAFERKTATPLHRAAFSGATATMQLLLHEQGCDLLARDNSFGDRKTPLHKAAAGGRYMAIQLLLDELRRRGQLDEAIRILDSSSRTPLQVARDFLPRQHSERESVARWDTIAGCVADWAKCVALLENVARHGWKRKDALPPLPPECTSMNHLPMHPQHFLSVEVCQSCDLFSSRVSSTMSWQAAFQSALKSAVNCDLAVPAVIVQNSAPPGNSESDVIMDTDTELPEALLSNKHEALAMGAACRVCCKETVTLFVSPKGSLVCKACHRARRERARSIV